MMKEMNKIRIKDVNMYECMCVCNVWIYVCMYECDVWMYILKL